MKVWNAARTIRKALVVSTYEEFQRKGREKVGLSPSEPVRVVLESDGTQVMALQLMYQITEKQNIDCCKYLKIMTQFYVLSFLRWMMENTFKHYLKTPYFYFFAQESYGALLELIL